MFNKQGRVVSNEAFAAFAHRKRDEFRVKAAAIQSFSERLAESRQERTLKRMEAREAAWERIQTTVSSKLSRPPTRSVVLQAEGYRERLEVNDILHEATPDGVKSPDSFWYSGLRKPKVEISHAVNRPYYNLRRSEALAEYTNSRPITGKGWFERPYLKDRLVLLSKRIKSLTPASIPPTDTFICRGIQSRQ
jgi:hypothetical protein